MTSAPPSQVFTTAADAMGSHGRRHRGRRTRLPRIADAGRGGNDRGIGGGLGHVPRVVDEGSRPVFLRPHQRSLLCRRQLLKPSRYDPRYRADRRSPSSWPESGSPRSAVPPKQGSAVVRLPPRCPGTRHGYSRLPRNSASKRSSWPSRLKSTRTARTTAKSASIVRNAAAFPGANRIVGAGRRLRSTGSTNRMSRPRPRACPGSSDRRRPYRGRSSPCRSGPSGTGDVVG